MEVTTKQKYTIAMFGGAALLALGAIVGTKLYKKTKAAALPEGEAAPEEGTSES